MVPAQQAAPNPVYEAYGPAATARAIRASLRAAAMPDPAAFAAIGLLILLWRVAKKQRIHRKQPQLVAISSNAVAEERRAA